MKKATSLNLIIGLAITSAALMGCPAPGGDSPTVYAAGGYYNGSSFFVCYWSGSTKTDLPDDGNNNAEAYAIFVQ